MRLVWYDGTPQSLLEGRIGMTSHIVLLHNCQRPPSSVGFSINHLHLNMKLVILGLSVTSSSSSINTNAGSQC